MLGAVPLSYDHAELQRRLAAEFGRRGWEYDLTVGPAVVNALRTSDSVDALALARSVPSASRRTLRITVDELADAISRALAGMTPKEGSEASSLKLLFVSAGPVDEVRLRLDAEHRDITHRIRASTARAQVTVEYAGAARPTDLIDLLNRVKPTVLHLAGHGGPSGIALENADGLAADVTTDQLVRLVATADDSLRLVVLNTCESAHQAQPITKCVDAAIGMTRSIGDDAAREFAAQLYSSLTNGVDLQRAFDQARLQISLAGLPEDTTPALFVRAAVDPTALRFTG